MKPHNKLSKEIVNGRLRAAGRNVVLVGDYAGASRRSKFSCDFGHTWVTTPSSVMQGTGCPHCSKNARLDTEYARGLLESDGRGIRLIGEYINSKTKVEFKCPKGHSWLSSANPVLRGGSGCPHCSKNARLSKEKVNERIVNSDRNIRLMGDFLTVEDKSEFICEMGHVWLATPRSVLSGNNCPHCAKQAPLSRDDVNARLSEHDRGIVLVGGYRNTMSKAEFECEKGHRWTTYVTNVLRRSGCPQCTRALDSVYVWESEGETYKGVKVYKIGVTKISRGVARILECSASSGRVAKILRLERVHRAPELERELLSIGEKPDYLCKFDGYSEMRALDGEELTRVLKLIDDNRETEDD